MTLLNSHASNVGPLAALQPNNGMNPINKPIIQQTPITPGTKKMKKKYIVIIFKNGFNYHHNYK